MTAKIRKYAWLCFGLLPFLLSIETCGLRNFLGNPEPNSPSAPCVELIPTPTPIPLSTPTPFFQPPAQPQPQPEGTPVIQDGNVITMPTPLSLPSPAPWGGTAYTISASYSFSGMPCPGGMSPTGTLSVDPGGSLAFSIGCSGGCTGFMISLDGVSINSGTCPASIAYTLSNINADHSVSALFF